MNRSRIPIVIVLIVSLLTAGVARRWSETERARGNLFNQYNVTSASGLGRMNSYALALLLGGLRGPLVMFLWPSSEEQKRDKDLEDFDTKIEWIRLLQAEFDTVHLFQIWNKAYNISAQLSNLGNKYRTIIDALDYAHSVDLEKPNDINILSAIGQIYFYKLGYSAEKDYYQARVRLETQARQEMEKVALPSNRKDEFGKDARLAGLLAWQLNFSPEDKAGVISITIPKSIADSVQSQFTGPQVQYTPRPIGKLASETGTRRTELDPVLDKNGDVLPQYLVARIPRPANLDPKSEWEDGSDLQYLPQFQPYKYGVSAFAMAYNYDKRSEVLQNVNKQKHVQSTDVVVDSRPALDLKNWAEEEWDRARRAELSAFDKPLPADRWKMELATADLPLDAPVVYPADLQEAIYSCKKSADLVDASLAEYRRHLANFTTNLTTYLSHMDDLISQQALLRGDYDFLVALSDPSQRAEKTKSAIEHYHDAITKYDLDILQYQTNDQQVSQFYPKGVTKVNVAKSNLPPQQLEQIVAAIRSSLPKDPNAVYENSDDFKNYFARLDRAYARLKVLQQ